MFVCHSSVILTNFIALFHIFKNREMVSHAWVITGGGRLDLTGKRFLYLFLICSYSLTLISFLFYISTMGRRKGGGAQARTAGKSGQAGGKGQEQGSFRSDDTGSAGMLTGGGRNRGRAGG